MAAVCAGIAGLICLIVVLLFANGVILLDHTAERQGDSFSWRGVRYVLCTADHHEGKAIAETIDGFRVLEVAEDKSHTFLVLRSFLDDQLYVREDYEIPDSGALNAVFWGGTKISDQDFCAAVAEILQNFRPAYQYETDGLHAHADGRQLEAVSYCYEDCPVGIDREDTYMGLLDGAWVFAKAAPDQQREFGEPVLYEICPIPAEQAAVIQAYMP